MKRSAILFLIIFFGFFVLIAHAEKLRGNAVVRDLLPESLKGYDVVDYHVPVKDKYIGYIQSKKGTLVVLHKKTKQAYFAMRKDKVYQGDLIFTLKKSRARLRFTTRDVITMGDNTHISMDDYADKPGQGTKKNVIGVAKGKAMFYVVRMFRYKSVSTSVKTQTAVMGIRGTKFGVGVTDVVETPVADQAALNKFSNPFYLADDSSLLALQYLAETNLAETTPPATGGQETVVHGFDGEVSVFVPGDGNTLTVGEGQSLGISPGGAGNVMPTPPSVSAAFQSSTEAPPPADEGGEDESSSAPAASGAVSDDGGDEGGDEGSSDGSAGGSDAGGDGDGETADAPPAPPEPPPEVPSVDIVVPTEVEPEPEIRHEYFASLITDNTNSALSDVHVVNNPKDPATEDLSGYGINTVSDFTTLRDGSSDNTGYVKQVKKGGFTSSEYAGSVHPFTKTQITDKTYMDWGYFTVPTTITVDAVDYSIDNRAYYLSGSLVENSARDRFTGEVTYKGPAYGTWWTNSGGEQLEGGMEAVINFGTNAVTDFDLSITDSTNTYWAIIENSQGTFNSTNPVFDLTTSSGTWELKQGAIGYTADKKSAQGSFYGTGTTHAPGMGGVFGMMDTTYGVGVAGIFQGTEPGDNIETYNMPVYNSDNDGSYFAALYTSGSAFQGVHIVNNPKNPNTEDLTGYGLKLTTDFTVIRDGDTENTGYVKEVKVDGYSSSEYATDAHPFTKTPITTKSYMDWGSFTVPTSMVLNATDYKIDNKSYYLSGDLVDNTTRDVFTGEVTYKGPAYGTWWTNTGGTELHGGVEAKINFATDTVTDFDLRITDSSKSYWAIITDEQGTFNGTNATFDLSTSISGTWEMKNGANNPYTPTYRKAYGSFFGAGPNHSRGIGGAFGMQYGTSYGVTGIFLGGEPGDVEAYTMPKSQGLFFASIYSEGSTFQDVHVSYDPADPRHKDVLAYGVKEPSAYSYVREGVNDKYIKKIVMLETGANYYQSSTFSETQHPFVGDTQYSETKSYMDWGHFTTPSSITGTLYNNDSPPAPIGNKNYTINHRSYYITGELVEQPDIISAFTGTVDYKGPAYGTWWNNASPILLEGGMEARIDFGNSGDAYAITDFDLRITDESKTYWASIDSATGAVRSSYPDVFEVSTSSGTWMLKAGDNQYTANYKKNYGSFYGDGTTHSQGIGGAFGMTYGTTYAVGGIFQGGAPGEVETYTMPEKNVRGKYFAALYADTQNAGTPLNVGVHIVSNPVNPRNDDLTATDIADANNFTTIRKGATGTGGYIKDVQINSIENPGEYADTDHTFTYTNVKDKLYMDWGYFQNTDTLLTDSSTYIYKFDNRAYYISGNLVENTVRNAYLDTTVNYQGPAYGTWRTTNSSVIKNLDGGMEAIINFGTNQITDFDLRIKDSTGNYKAYINSATGSYNTSDTYFTLGSGGWWLEDNGTFVQATTTGAYGSFFGNGSSSSKGIGGAFGMSSTEYSVAGIFQGSQPDDAETYTMEKARGYYYASLYTDGVPGLEDVHLVSNPLDPRFDNIVANGMKTSGDYTNVRKDAAGIVYISKVNLGGTQSADYVPADHPFVKTALKTKSYMEWGYFTVPTTMATDDNYIIDNRSYYLTGDLVTNPVTIDKFNGTVLFKGPAYATWWTNAGNRYLEGGLEATINFGASGDAYAITDFDIRVTDSSETYWAFIEDATGAVSGSNSAVFDIDTNSGSWMLKNGDTRYTPDYKKANGSFYGEGTNNSQGMGGVFGMVNTANSIGVGGAFQGGPPGDVETSDMHEYYGYFTAMVTDHEGTEGANTADDSLEGIFLTKNLKNYRNSLGGNSLQDNNSSITTNNGLNYLATSKMPSTSDIKSYNSTDAPVVNEVELGLNSYMEWGRWNVLETFYYDYDNEIPSLSSQGSISNYAYYVKGVPTPGGVNVGLENYTYTGSAGGTWWSPGGTGEALNSNGIFQCTINGANGFTSFSMSVDNGVDDTTSAYRGVEISGASGTISGSDFVVNAGTFELIEGTTRHIAGLNGTYGSFYGPNAENTGGIWAMKKEADSNIGANGFFEGTQQPSTP